MIVLAMAKSQCWTGTPRHFFFNQLPRLWNIVFLYQVYLHVENHSLVAFSTDLMMEQMGGDEVILEGFPNVEGFLYSQSGNLFHAATIRMLTHVLVTILTEEHIQLRISQH